MWLLLLLTLINDALSTTEFERINANEEVGQMVWWPILKSIHPVAPQLKSGLGLFNEVQ
jgi:hypothetical protein